MHGLIECPDVPECVVVLACTSEGERQILAVLRLEDPAPCANLASIRHIGATLGAKEVHVYLGASDSHERRRLACDLEAALGATVA